LRVCLAENQALSRNTVKIVRQRSMGAQKSHAIGTSGSKSNKDNIGLAGSETLQSTENKKEQHGKELVCL
jgi:hypothetical protein